MTVVGRVAECWRYPVKSMQGVDVDHLDLGRDGIEGDRAWGLIDLDSQRLMSAKRYSRLLHARADDTSITLPDGTRVDLQGPDANRYLSRWLGRSVALAQPSPDSEVSYQMTFDPPDDEADYYDIPVREGTFLDLSAVHLITTATLEHARARRPDLDWNVRRFRPNLVIELDERVDADDGFVEDAWCGLVAEIGDARLQAVQSTVRCAMPLRAQPGGLRREPELFGALNELNAARPNHLGVYLDVTGPGRVVRGDPISIGPPG